MLASSSNSKTNPTNPTNPTSLSTQACDTCNFRKLKCDRELPSCQRCLKRKDTCTYDRKLKKGSKLNSANSTNPLRERTKFSKIHSATQPQIVAPTRTIKFGPIQDKRVRKNSHHQAVFRVFKTVRKYEKQNLSLFWNQPGVSKRSIFDVNPKSLLSVMGSTWTSFLANWVGEANIVLIFSSKKGVKALLDGLQSVQRVAQIATLHPYIASPSEHLKLKPLLNKAIQIYFEKMNPFFPLFLPSTFFLRPRSMFLLSAIYASGLRLLPQTPEVQALLAYYQAQLLSLSSPISNKINLDYIQALLVSYYGLRGLSLPSRLYWLSNGAVVDMGHSIGLHLKPPNKCQTSIRIERNLAYIAIAQNDALKHQHIGIPGMLSFNHSFPHYRAFDRLAQVLNPMEYALLLVAKFNYNHAETLQQLCWLKWRIKAKIILQPHLILATKSIISTLEQGYGRCLNQLRELRTVVSLGPELRKLGRILGCISIEYHYLKLLIYYESGQFFNDSTQIAQTLCSEGEDSLRWLYTNMDDAFNSCFEIFNLIDLFNQDEYYPDRMNGILYSLLFLIRYHRFAHKTSKSILWIHEQVEKGINILREHVLLVSLASRASYYLHLAFQVSELFNFDLPKNK